MGSRSKSRSDSRDKKSKKKKEKRPYEEHSKKSRKSHRDRSRSNSKSKEKKSFIDKSPKSKSGSRSGSRDREKRQGNRFDGAPKNLQRAKGSVDQDGKRRYAVNNFALAGFLLENRRTNERLDKDEVAKANMKFKQIDHSERQSVLLSAALSKTDEWKDREEYFMEFKNGEYVKVMKPF